MRLVPAFVKYHNSQNVTNTNVKRSSVDKHNYVGLLSEIFKIDSPTMLFNISATEDYPDPLAKLIFRYEIGDLVLIARRADFTLTDNKSHFEKVSAVGAFGDRVHVISRRMGKHNSNLWITPVYQVSDIPGAWWYTSELVPASFSAEAKSGIKKKLKQQRLFRMRKAKKLSAAAAASAPADHQ